MKRVVLSAVLFGLIPIALAQDADKVYLKSGKVIEGRVCGAVKAKNKEQVILIVDGVRREIDRKDIDHIDRAEYRPNIPDDAECERMLQHWDSLRDPVKLYDLGIYCRHKGDEAQAEKCFRRALCFNPHRVGAHLALGHKQDSKKRWRVKCRRCRSEGWVPCAKCILGKVEVPCPECKGRRAVCTMCKGLGRLTCPACGGRRPDYRCPKCGGSGIRYDSQQGIVEKCPDCRGTGRGGGRACTKCVNGTVDCPACVGGRIPCERCRNSGTIQVACPRCEGTGSEPCPDCEALAVAALARAAVCCEKGNYTGAIAEYTTVLTIDPMAAEAYEGRGDARHRKGEHAASIADYTARILLTPNDPVGYCDRADAFDELGEHDHTIADCMQAIALNPRCGRAYNICGLAYQKKGDRLHALADFRKAIETGYLLHLVYTNCGRIYHAEDDYTHAIAEYDKAIQHEPDYARAFYWRADAYKELTHYDRAIADYTKAIELDADNASWLVARAETHLYHGDYDKAIADATTAITLAPDEFSPYRTRADAHFARGDLNRAAADYDKAVQAEPDRAWAYVCRGLFRLSIGSLPEAAEDLRKAVGINPEGVYAGLLLFVAQARMGTRETAHLHALTRKQDLGEWGRQLLRLYLGEIQPEACLRATKAAEPRLTRERLCEAHYYIAQLLLIDGEKPKAAEHFRECIDTRVTEFIEHGAARAELARLGALTADGRSRPAAAPGKEAGSIDQLLDTKRVSFGFTDRAIADVAVFLCVMIDRDVIQVDPAVPNDLKITLKLKNVPLRTALDNICLQDDRLTYVVEKGLVRIKTK